MRPSGSFGLTSRFLRDLRRDAIDTVEISGFFSGSKIRHGEELLYERAVCLLHRSCGDVVLGELREMPILFQNLRSQIEIYTYYVEVAFAPTL